jgi:hypothetical protein
MPQPRGLCADHQDKTEGDDVSGTERCDEVLRVIDEVLTPRDAPTDVADGPTDVVELDRHAPEWTSLVRWGLVPKPFVRAAS